MLDNMTITKFLLIVYILSVSFMCLIATISIVNNGKNQAKYCEIASNDSRSEYDKCVKNFYKYIKE